jgi:hypothetical protein
MSEINREAGGKGMPMGKGRGRGPGGPGGPGHGMPVEKAKNFKSGLKRSPINSVNVAASGIIVLSLTTNGMNSKNGRFAHTV